MRIGWLQPLLLIGIAAASALGASAEEAPAQLEAAREAAANRLEAAREAAANRVEVRGATQTARKLWEWAELGYQEERSAALLSDQLANAGFEVERGVASMPTAFIASAGSGRPVIAILAEYDALPGLSQEALPKRQPREADAPGHACGHHLFGSGSIAAALAVKDWLEDSETPGTLRVYGTPAEEGGAGKAYLARAGHFADVDVALHWHPADHNAAQFSSSLANKSAKFRFHGQAAHASAAPERGRSALDGVEAMNHMVNLLREHVPETTRIHYVITRGGTAPNVVPEFAEVFLYARHPDPIVLQGIWERIVAASRGAAEGTGTRVEHEIIHGSHSVLPNEVLARRMHANLEALGGIEYDEAEDAFAAEVFATLISPTRELGSQMQIQPFAFRLIKASTDVGDVSWNVPTVGLRTATWVPGTPAHSWQAVSAGGMSIGFKGMELAARALARTAAELFLDAQLLKDARKEFEERRGPGFEYVSLVGDRDPPLDYRQ